MLLVTISTRVTEISQCTSTQKETHLYLYVLQKHTTFFKTITSVGSATEKSR